NDDAAGRVAELPCGGTQHYDHAEVVLFSGVKRVLGTEQCVPDPVFVQQHCTTTQPTDEFGGQRTLTTTGQPGQLNDHRCRSRTSAVPLASGHGEQYAEDGDSQ